MSPCAMSTDQSHGWLALGPVAAKCAYIRRCATARDRAALTGSWLRLGTPPTRAGLSPLPDAPEACQGPSQGPGCKARRRVSVSRGSPSRLKLGGRPLIGCGSLILPNPWMQPHPGDAFRRGGAQLYGNRPREGFRTAVQSEQGFPAMLLRFWNGQSDRYPSLPENT